MAQGKKSFVAYADWKEVFDELPNEDAGALIKHIFAYVNDENPTTDSVLIKAVFANIKSTLKRDLQKWEKQLQQRSDAGKKSAELRAEKKVNERSTVVEIRQRKPTVNDTVNVNVNDTVTVSTNVDVEKENFADAKNISFSEDLKFNSMQWIETVAMQHRITPEVIPKKIDEFIIFLRTKQKIHNSKKEFIDHFTNWISKNLKDAAPKTTNRNR